MLKYLSYLQSHIIYARVMGIILFLVGLLGFAFRGASSLPDAYLIGALVFGFWGIIVSFSTHE